MANSRKEAIEVTNKVLNELTNEKAHQIFVEECEVQVNQLNLYVWNEYDVRGWYYDETRYCGDVITVEYLNRAMEHAKTKAINKV